MAVLRELRVHAFRNLQDQTVSFAPGLNVFSGANGQGKTNLLEAVFFLGLLRSFRTSRVARLVQWEHDACAVDGQLELDAGRELKIGVRHGTKRRLLRAEQTVARASDYLGTMHCVPVVPEDLQLVKGPARLRRQFLDVTLAPHDVAILHALQSFNNALAQRNVLLRGDAFDPIALASFDAVMIPAAAAIVHRRAAFIRQLAIEVNVLLADLPAPALPLEIRYQPGFTTDVTATSDRIAEDFRASLARSADRDQRYGQSHVGPQRDDFRILLDGRPIAEIGSEGQCRLAAILIRLAAARVLTGEDDPPIVLVDDVIGELDCSRRDYFLALLTDLPQVLFACTDAASLPTATEARRFEVVEGNITE